MLVCTSSHSPITTSVCNPLDTSGSDLLVAVWMMSAVESGTVDSARYTAIEGQIKLLLWCLCGGVEVQNVERSRTSFYMSKVSGSCQKLARRYGPPVWNVYPVQDVVPPRVGYGLNSYVHDKG